MPADLLGNLAVQITLLRIIRSDLVIEELGALVYVLFMNGVLRRFNGVDRRLNIRAGKKVV